MRVRTHELLLGVFLTVAVFAIGMLFASSIRPYANTEQSSDAQHSKEKSIKVGDSESSDEKIARYTLWLAILTGGLVVTAIGQGYFLLRSDKTARIAADAAKLNAQAVISAERAYVFVEISLETVVDIIEYMRGMQGVAPRGILIQYRFTNYGKTPAFIRSITYGAVVAENLPRQREYSQILHLPTHLLGAGQSTKAIEYDEFSISSAIADSIDNLKDTFWFYGNIVYDDMFVRQKTLNFVFHASGISEGFTLYRYDETDEKREN
jgi:hypothetical protein